MTVSLQDVNETLLPRRYQEEIFTRAREGNVIAALDTGSGKTYISTLLIKWIAAQEVNKHKNIIFLVPKVALVEQQGDFIAKQTPLTVSKSCGATAMDLSDRVGWKKELERANVLIMTAQIFLNILTHSLWSLDKVSLIVFDECHHTRKNHAYNGIMREYFQYPRDQRPKIFGMTASPIWNPKDAVLSLATLERNLDAKVIAVREHVDELMGHSPKPQEIIHEYPAPPTIYPEYPCQSLWDRLDLMSIPPEIDIPADKIRTRYQVTYHSLGPYGADVYLYYEIKQRVIALIQQASNVDLEYLAISGSNSVINDIVFNETTAANIHPEIMELQKILLEFKDAFEDENNPDTVPITVHLKWCSPKVRVLVDLLFAHYTSSFQGIIFVEQRHVASALAKMLPRVPQLSHLVRCAQLIGHGTNGVLKSHATGMALKVQQDIVRSFRDRQVNLLVATSVAEEGLDFPACDVVVRFDPLQHMVGYLQSRGRARHKTSTFVIMVQQGQVSQMERYRAFYESEPQLRRVYQTRDNPEVDQAEDDEDERDHPTDLAERERYVVPSTGAILTYNSSIGLLNHLCSLIPRDRFTPVHLPQYSGDFIATVQLPSSLPLPPGNLTFTGPPKHSKKEAKRAVAFAAVKRLHALNVFDDFLLPARSATGGDNEDGDGRVIQDVRNVPENLDVLVRDPWTRGAVMWMHIVYLDGRPTAGLVTGTMLPPVELVCGGSYVSTGPPSLVNFDPDDEWRQRRAMQDFMRMGVWWCITGRGITLPLTSYLVPVIHGQEVDFDAIDRAVLNPFGSYDWSGIGVEHYDHLLVTFNREYGRPLLLRGIRTDVSPMSAPPPGSREAGHATYRDYWLHKYSRNDKVLEVPVDGPCIEGQPFPRHTTCVYRLDGGRNSCGLEPKPTTVLFPQAMCRWADISEDVYRTFGVLPELAHRITDIFRARIARIELHLPPIMDDLLVQALTLPSANAGFNNQRLETLGDSVLKLSTAVHLFNKYPHRHEGQLDVLRRNSVANRTLLARALEIRLQQYLTSESQSMRIWRYTLPSEVDPWSMKPFRYARRAIPRRSMQDCMEALLGASFVTGGINMALQAGTALGLSFGGPLPWYERYGKKLPETEASALFTGLQATLGYQFRCGHLLLEAVTHPSFRSWESSSYQRLEFLGDALIDLVVMRYLYRKFPNATSGQLSWARSRAVCAPALASVAVKHLNLHKILLINNVELSIAISKCVPVLADLSNDDIINNGWKQDPPKAISDVLESVLGAVLVDSEYDFEKACVVAEMALQDLLEVLTPDLPRDPVSELMVWAAQSGCRKFSFRKSQSRPEIKRNDSISVIVHDIAVVGPIVGNNMSLAKGLAAEKARIILNDGTSPHRLSLICNCGQQAHDVKAAVEEDVQALNDETEEGFAALAQIVNAEVNDIVAVEDGSSDSAADDAEDGSTWGDEQEVEEMMQIDEAVPNAVIEQVVEYADSSS